jgi:hypothetical protein
MPEAIFGTVAAVDPEAKTLRVSAVMIEPSGAERTEELEIPFAEDTAFKSKRTRMWGSKLGRVKPGMNVIVQREGPEAPASEVWHDPVIGPIKIGTIALTQADCTNLGGTITDDKNCPDTSPLGSGPEVIEKKRCTTKGGHTMCVDTRRS